MKAAFFLLILLMLSLSARTQESRQGDSTVIGRIMEMMHSLYGKNDTTLIFLTQSSFQKLPAYGTELQVEKIKGVISRIISNCFTEKGNLAEEYWFYHGELVFVYQTFIYFIEKAPGYQPFNFRGQRFWETRFYLVHEKLKFQATTGKIDSEAAYLEKDLLREKESILGFLNRQ